MDSDILEVQCHSLFAFRVIQCECRHIMTYVGEQMERSIVNLLSYVILYK